MDHPGIRNTIVPCELFLADQHSKATKVEY